MFPAWGGRKLGLRDLLQPLQRGLADSWGTLPVLHVPKDGVAYHHHVAPELVSAARAWPQVHQRDMLALG